MSAEHDSPAPGSFDPTVDALYPIVYGELQRMAHGLRPSDSVTPTSLVHDAYLRLAKLHEQDWDALRVRAVAASAMRSVLVDRARRRNAAKRGGGRERVTLSALGDEQDLDLLALHEALDRLEEDDPLALRIVELRFFGGLSNAEVSEVLSVSLRTIERRWRAARALLRHLLDDEPS